MDGRVTKTRLSLKGARRWLYRLGYRRQRHKKGVYWDGHEREDVVQYREEFLQKIKGFELQVICLQ